MWSGCLVHVREGHFIGLNVTFADDEQTCL